MKDHQINPVSLRFLDWKLEEHYSSEKEKRSGAALCCCMIVLFFITAMEVFVDPLWVHTYDLYTVIHMDTLSQILLVGCEAQCGRIYHLSSIIYLLLSIYAIWASCTAVSGYFDYKFNRLTILTYCTFKPSNLAITHWAVCWKQHFKWPLKKLHV